MFLAQKTLLVSCPDHHLPPTTCGAVNSEEYINYVVTNAVLKGMTLADIKPLDLKSFSQVIDELSIHNSVVLHGIVEL